MKEILFSYLIGDRNSATQTLNGHRSWFASTRIGMPYNMPPPLFLPKYLCNNLTAPFLRSVRKTQSTFTIRNKQGRLPVLVSCTTPLITISLGSLFLGSPLYHETCHLTVVCAQNRSRDGLQLLAASADGFCSLICFEKGELGEILPDPIEQHVSDALAAPVVANAPAPSTPFPSQPPASTATVIHQPMIKRVTPQLVTTPR